MGKIRVFTLIDRKVTEDSYHENDANKKLDFPVWHGIKNPFFVSGDGGKRVWHRYIKGAGTTLVTEQDASGIPFNPLVDVLGFDSGNDLLIDEEADKAAIDFLTIHPENPKSKYHNSKIHDAKFSEFIAEEKAKDEVKKVEIEDKAIDLLRSLVKDEKKLKNVAAIFGVPILNSPSEIYIELRKRALSEPDLFVKSIAEKKNTYIANIKKALVYDVVQKTDKGFVFKDEGGLIFGIDKVKSEKENENLLLEFLMSDEGKAFNDQIRLKVDGVETKLIEPKK